MSVSAIFWYSLSGRFLAPTSAGSTSRWWGFLVFQLTNCVCIQRLSYCPCNGTLAQWLNKLHNIKKIFTEAQGFDTRNELQIPQTEPKTCLPRQCAVNDQHTRLSTLVIEESTWASVSLLYYWDYVCNHWDNDTTKLDCDISSVVTIHNLNNTHKRFNN